MIKVFDYKRQMINYYNKVIANSNIEMASRYFSLLLNKYVVTYSFKNK